MAAALVPDALWSLIRPLLPASMPKPQCGRPRVSDRACLTGILFVLRSGIPWRMLCRRTASISARRNKALRYDEICGPFGSEL
jgi:transposase